MIRVAIVEDEEESANRLKEMLGRYAEEEGCSFSVEVFGDGMNFVSDYRAVYDVVFMDIEMPHLNGMNAAKKMRRADPDVALIFVTHLAKYALQGYEIDAVGYILKPVDYFSLHRKIKQITGRCEKEGGEEIFVKTVSGLVRISLRTLRYVEVLDHWLVYHTAHGDHKVYGSIARAEESLPPPAFFKCNKSYIVNFRYVERITRTGVFIGGEEILVSRSRQKELMKAFNAYAEG